MILASLGVEASGERGLALYERNGTSRVKVGMGTDGTPFLGVTDQAGRRRASLTPIGFAIHDETGPRAAVLDSGFAAFAKGGKAIWQAP